MKNLFRNVNNKNYFFSIHFSPCLPHLPADATQHAQRVDQRPDKGRFWRGSAKEAKVLDLVCSHVYWHVRLPNSNCQHSKTELTLAGILA